MLSYVIICKMESLDYLHLQMKLEGKGLDSDGRLVRQEVVAGETLTLPLVLLAQLGDGQVACYLQAGLPVDLQAELSELAGQLEFPHIEPLLACLRQGGLRCQAGHYKTYTFPEHYRSVETGGVQCLPSDDPRVKTFGFAGLAEQVYAIEDEGVVVSACVSVRQNSACAECWVYTLPQYRRRGLAQLAAAAWTRSMLAAGRLPFYSHKIENLGSANLAGRLELIPLFEEIGIDRED